MPTTAKSKAKNTAERKARRGKSSQTQTKTKGVSAVQLLEQDHREVEEYFDSFDEAKNDRAKEELAQKICMALTVHAQIEEEIFYPAARRATGDNDLLDEAVVEHASAKKLIAEIEEMEVGEELFDAKVRVLGEQIKHHVREEEEELFPELDRTDLDLEALGAKMAARKEELMDELQDA
ncbi:MAG: hemerythrin domain-containing protein [Alphaproteobacteria bacterium]|nr:hemerythrin domain-containing protein [Alphaproteobacteria bacterium]